MTVGERIRKVRKSKKMTQTKLAELLDVSYMVISQYERGLRNPKRETIQRIADALSIHINELQFDGNLNSDNRVDPELATLYPKMENGTATEEERHRFLEIWSKAISSLDSLKLPVELLRAATINKYDSLNYDGQTKAYSYVSDLTKIPEYKEE